MANPASSARPAEGDVPLTSPLAAFLSYLVPGLGQLYQGRIAKGLLFFVCLYGLFFYGMFLGHGTARAGDRTYTITSNVYLPDTAERSNPLGLPRLFANLYNRPQFAGQFWVGIAAWPALWHYNHPGDSGVVGKFLNDFEAPPEEWAVNDVQRRRNKLWDLGWVYTVIAGVLNVMVIYDAYSGPLFVVTTEPTETLKEGSPA